MNALKVCTFRSCKPGKTIPKIGETEKMSRIFLDKGINETYEQFNLPFEEFTELTVTVLRCRRISGGFLHDMVDTPDPRVLLKCVGATGITEQRTKTKLNSVDVEVKETFSFVLESHGHDQNEFKVLLQVILEDVDRFNPDDILGEKVLDITDIGVDVTKSYALHFGQYGQVDLDITKTIRTGPSFRYSLGLGKKELKMRELRKANVLEAMKKHFGSEHCPSNVNEVPNISIAGSGGGYRATIAYAGAMEALMEEGIFDMSSDLYGLSGGGWYLTSLFAHHGYEGYQKLRRFHSHLKQAMSTDMKMKIFDVAHIYSYLQYRKTKLLDGQPLSFVDVYGYTVGSCLLGNEKLHTKLSDFQTCLLEGSAPLPFITSIQVQNSKPASEFHAHLEISPFEVSLPRYGINLKTEDFGSEWFKGCLTRKCKETPVHFLQGQTGSAFAIRFKELMNGKNTETSEEFDEKMGDFREDLMDANNNELSDETNSYKDDVLKNHSIDGSEELLLRANKLNVASNENSWDLSNLSLFTDRDFLIDRTAKLLNFSRGLGQIPSFPLNPLHKSVKTDNEHKLDTTKSVSHYIDAGIFCNVPALNALRPQRNCNVLIVLDFSKYSSDDKIDYFRLLNVERLATKNGIKFPKVDAENLIQTNEKELHVFEDQNDIECPIVLWFTLAATSFRKVESFKRQEPIKDETFEPVPTGERFNDFSAFGNSDCSTFSLSYSALVFDRCKELMKFNVKSNIQTIKEAIIRATVKRKLQITKAGRK